MAKTGPETAIKKQIREYLRYNGWFVRHHFAGLGSYVGMPDISATKAGITLEIEVKTPGKKQSPGQLRYEEDLQAHGGHYVLAQGYEDIELYILDILREKNETE